MPRPGVRWRHVTIGTHNSWLPGDPRGFRSRHHRVHSSGDYKNLPPAGEHVGLHRYSRRVGSDAVAIPRDLRPVAGKAILLKLKKLDYRVLVLSVSGMHTHMLVELPDDMKEIRHILGQCKTASSHAIRERLPGQVWAYGGKAKPVDDREYQRRVYSYILRQEDAWIWSYKDGFQRK